MYKRDIKQELFFYSIEKEKQQQNFIKKKQSLKNTTTGEILNLKYSFDSKQKEYIKTIEQKVNALVSIATSQMLSQVFITLTLPSKYHPNKTLKNGTTINNEIFSFKNINDAIHKGYKELKNIYRIFYKRLKSSTKDIYFIKVTEPHKSLIPHMHVLLFVKKAQIDKTKRIFFKVCKENKLKRVEFDESLMNENINNAVGYIMKYILKTLNSNDQFFKRWIDGWRKKYKIRACEMSKLPISIEVYKKLYYNLSPDLKESIQKEIELKNQSFFEYFINNTEVHQIIYEKEKKQM